MDFTIPTAFAERDWERDVDETFRLAVVGLGWFGRDVALPAIRQSDYCEATVLVTGSPGAAESVADEHDVDRVLTYEEYEDGEATDAYDAVYVVTPNALHLDHVTAAARQGKHVLCEKPLEATSERAARLVDACRDAGVELMTAYRMQTTRSVRWMREQIRAGVVGDPVQVHSENEFDLIGGGDTDQWRLDPDLAGGGSMMDIGVYPLNTARFVLDADPVAVNATTASTRPAFDGVEEHVTFQLDFSDPLTASCTASYGATGRSRLSVVGTDGRITVESVFDIDGTRTVTIERDGGETTVTAAEPPELVEEFDYFATGVLTDLDVEPDGADGRFDVDVVEAVYESAETGRRVEL